MIQLPTAKEVKAEIEELEASSRDRLNKLRAFLRVLETQPAPAETVSPEAKPGGGA